MDLIYADTDRKDLGVLKDYKWDLAYGVDENNFECEVALDNNICKPGYILYMENTEYGGMIDTLKVDTDADTLTFAGKTWHGILEAKVIQPDDGEDYLTVSGDANQILQMLIERMTLTELFQVSPELSGIHIPAYKMERYVKGYTGIRKMLKTANAKLNLIYDGMYVKLSAEPVVDYSADEQFDADQISFKISKAYNPVNHMICLGSGELHNRTVLHLYADSDGNISRKQSQIGIQENCDVYDYSNAESDEDLLNKGMEKLQEAWASSTIDCNFSASSEVYDIGDIIGASERTTGITAKAYITKKIVSVSDETVVIDYDSAAMTGTVEISE